MVNQYYEGIRIGYKPNHIKVLYIGESRPQNGTFFYLGNSILYRAIADAMFKADALKNANGRKILDVFRDLGLYLDDLCLEPVNKLSPEHRKKIREKYINSLAKRIAIYNPQVICTVMMGINKDVYKAVSLSGIGFNNIIYHGIPFPVRFPTKFSQSAQLHLDFLNSLKARNIVTF